MNTVRFGKSVSAARLLTLACLSSTCLSSMAFAQAQTAQAPAVVDEIVVTGTRVVRDGYEAPTPVSVIGVEQLDNIATSNLADAINQIPAVVNSATPQTSAANTTSGQSAINGLSLRGLGVSRTLVLLNGQRTVGSNLTGAVDVSELPQHLIERVDVVTGGASAAYGSDALSGVVNFVLDTDFTGLKAEVSGGLTTYGDVPNYKVNAAFGTPFAGGRGHFLLSGEHVWDDGLLVYDRPWTREGHSFINNPAFVSGNGQPSIIKTNRVSIGNASWGGTIVAGPLKGTSFGPGGSIYNIAYGDIVPPGAAIMRGGSWDALNVIAVRGVAAQPQQNRQDVFTRASYDISDNVNVYAQAAWGHLFSYSSGAPNFFPGNLTVSTDNAFLPQSLRPGLEPNGTVTTFTMGTLNWDLDNFRAVYDRRVLRFLTGATGSFATGETDWNWDAHLGVGQAFGTLQSRGAIDRTRYPLAADAVRGPNGQIVCRSTLTNPTNGCVPYNVFGIGVNSAAAVQYLQGRYGWNLQRLNQKVAAVNFTGEPLSTWAGPISTAFGYEFRREKMRQVVDPEEIANPTIWFQAAGQPYTGAFTVHDFYGETVVPLAKDAKWATALDLNGSVRFTHYSTYGSVVTYKVGATYAPFDDLRFRLTQSRNIRSPTLVDLYQAGSTSRSSSLDAFNGNRTINSQVTTRGNPNLGPEKSNDIGVGLVYQPSWFDGFSASVDYYRIRIKDAVNQIGAQDLINFCFNGNQTACQSVIRTGTGTAAEQLEITVQPQNFATELARGIDFEASYTLAMSDVNDMFDGNLGLRFLATHFMDYKTFSGIPGDIEQQNAGAAGGGGIGGGGGGVPSWRINSSVNYALDPVNFGFGFRWISKARNNVTWIECTSGCPNPVGQRITVDDNSVDSALFIDFNAAYTMAISDSAETELFFNIRNITNADPPIRAGGPGGSSWDFAPASSSYDILGRVFRAGIKLKM